jgi:transcription antitermination factor NusG
MLNESWHVLHVIANHENRVARHLVGRSVEYYLPLYTERSRWTDRTVTLERPLFPGYVFVRFPAHSRLSVITTPSVLKILGDSCAETVDCTEIDRIRESLAGGYILRPHPQISAGTSVRICNGIFAGTEGIVTDLRRKCTVIIALSAAGQCFSLEADISDIEVVSKTNMQAEKRLPMNSQRPNTRPGGETTPIV